MATIRRNTKRLRQVLHKAENIQSHTLASGFKGIPLPEDCLSPLAWADRITRFCSPRQYLAEILEVFTHAKMRENSDGSFTLGVHSNEWYTFEAGA